MPNTTETITKPLGKIRQELLAEGFSEHETFQLILDLVRRGSDTPAFLGISSE